MCNNMTSQNLRTEFLRTSTLPTQTQVRESLGISLAELFFNYVDDRLRKPFGLQPIMKGVTSESLWLSPSDILVGKVLMTPPMPTRRVVRALTHEGILEIGGSCLYKLENEARVLREKALMELQARLETQFQEQLLKAVAEARREEQEKADKYIGELLEECREDMQVALEETERSLARKTAVLIQEERAEVHGLLEDQMVYALEMQYEKMQREFSEELHQLMRDLYAGFREQKLLLRETYEWRLDLQRFQCLRYVEFLRVSLETQNAADLSYAVCRERQRCQADHMRLLREMEAEAERLGQIIAMKNQHLAEAALAAQRQQVEIGRWRMHLRQLLHEFQKFINFALKAVPGQAEFLLSLEKLMKLEARPEDTEPTVDAEELLAKSVSLIEDFCGLTHKDSLTSSPSVSTAAEEITKTPSEESMTPSERVNSILNSIINEVVIDPEELVSPLIHGIIDKFPPEMADAATQIPSFIQTTFIDKVLSPSPSLESTINFEDELLEEFAGKKVKLATSSAVIIAKAMVECLVSTTEKEVGIEDQNCAFCEIEDQQTLDVCQKDLCEKEEPVEEEPVEEASIEQGFLARGYVGEGGREHEQEPEEFIHDRVQSMLKLFHDHPSLTSMFISS